MKGDVYYHNRTYMRFNRVLEGLKQMEGATGEKLDIAYPTSRKVFTHKGRVRWAPKARSPYEVNISPGGGRFPEGEKVEVKLSMKAGDADIRYTVDGGAPGPASPVYSEPVVLADSKTLNAAALKDGKRAGPVSSVSFVFMRPREPDGPTGTAGKYASGLRYAYYHGEWDRLPDFEKLAPQKTGSAEGFDIGLRSRDDNFGFVFTGFIQVDEEGEYRFFTKSDDGSRLWIGDLKVVENDGLHAPQERSGSILLKPGKHAVRVAFFDKGGGEALGVRYQTPGGRKCVVPASALWCEREPGE